MEKTLFKTTIDLNCKVSKKGSFGKALADYGIDNSQVQAMPMGPITAFDKIAPLNELILRQPDLLYVVSTFASQGANKNWDGFLRPVLARIFETAKNKFVDFEHDVDAEKKDVNPEGYQIVGHIYDSCLATQETGSLIPNYEVYCDDDGKLFCKDSPYRNQAIDVVVAWVLYQFQYPEIADLIVKEFQNGDDGKFGVSMEILFSDYKFRVGEFDPNEDFDFDATSIGKIEGRKGTPLGEELMGYWKKRKLFNGQPVTRIFGGTVFFSGMAVTSNRASGRSYNMSLASIKEIKETETNKEFLALLNAVASRNKDIDMSTCKIENGEPDCDCLENAIASELNTITVDMEKLKEWFAKKQNYGEKMFIDKSSESKADMGSFYDSIDEDNIMGHLDNASDYLKKANLYLQNLYENNLDGDFSADEIMESLEEIESILAKARKMCS